MQRKVLYGTLVVEEMCVHLLTKEVVVCVTTRLQEREQTNPKPPEIPAMTVLAKHTEFEKEVRMQCLEKEAREVDQAYIGLWRGWRACS